MDKKLREACLGGQYQHFISLGCNCQVALELEQLGLRDSSMPYDWIRTKWKAIEHTINTDFADFLKYDNLFQDKRTPYIYTDFACGTTFVHDFVDYFSLKSQMKRVNKKYRRRIELFKHNICEPTLFIRYCRDREELIYIAENYASIEKTFKQYHSLNDIVFITHEKTENIPDTVLDKIEHLFVFEKDETIDFDSTPISKCPDLLWLLTNAAYDKRESNLAFLQEKIAKDQKPLPFHKRLQRRYICFYKRTHKKYTHHKVF